MAITIKDGTGKGYEAKVSDKGRLNTLSISQSELHNNSIIDGKVFSLGTNGFIDINTANQETACLYVKNTSTSDRCVIHSMRTCGNQVQKVIIYKNPTTGTIIDNAVAGHEVNLNFSSSNIPEATTYKGANGYTFTDGTLLGQHVNNVGHSTETTSDALILGPNDSLGISFELPASGVVCANLEAYFESAADI